MAVSSPPLVFPTTPEKSRSSIAQKESAVIEIQPDGEKPPLFLVHGVGGGMFWGYANLALHLGLDQPVFGFRSRGGDGLSEFDTIDAMAAHYVRELKRIQPVGPYRIGGYCFGGNVAFEMARILESQGDEIAFLGLFNAAPPNSSYQHIKISVGFLIGYITNLMRWIREYLTWDKAARNHFMYWKVRVVRRLVHRLVTGKKKVAKPTLADDVADLASVPKDQRRLWMTHLSALQKFHCETYPGKVWLFRTRTHPIVCSFEEDYAWNDYALGGVEVSYVDGVHQNLMEDPHVRTLAAAVREKLV